MVIIKYALKQQYIYIYVYVILKYIQYYRHVLYIVYILYKYIFKSYYCITIFN